MRKISNQFESIKQKKKKQIRIVFFFNFRLDGSTYMDKHNYKRLRMDKDDKGRDSVILKPD